MLPVVPVSAPSTRVRSATPQVTTPANSGGSTFHIRDAVAVEILRLHFALAFRSPPNGRRAAREMRRSRVFLSDLPRGCCQPPYSRFAVLNEAYVFDIECLPRW